MGKVFAIPMAVETQKEPLDKYCFGSCGKISMGGAVHIGEVGLCWVCAVEDCPHEKGHTDAIGVSQLTGDDVHVRGLVNA